MKKFLLLLFFTLFISATPDSENLNITIERKQESTIVISWNVLYEEFDTITLKILHEEKTETYDIPLSEGSIEICCYVNEVTVTINVKVTKVIQLPNEDCAADSCISFEREEFQCCSPFLSNKDTFSQIKNMLLSIFDFYSPSRNDLEPYGYMRPFDHMDPIR